MLRYSIRNPFINKKSKKIGRVANIFYNNETVDLREKVNENKQKSNININEIFISKVFEQKIPEKFKLLDIGTGNGYVLENIRKRNKTCKLYGIDNSKTMVEKCEVLKSKHIEVILGSNYEIPFNNNYFDMVTAKNVTRFSAKEVFRVLKTEGKFIYREYGEGKGLIEISDLFKKRLIRSRKLEYYLKLIEESDFNVEEVKRYLVEKIFENVEDIIDVIKSFPMIKNFSSKDEKQIREYFINKKTIKVTSDPFILIGKKIKIKEKKYEKNRIVV